MKKLTSFLLALSVVSSIFALPSPQNPPSPKKMAQTTNAIKHTQELPNEWNGEIKHLKYYEMTKDWYIRIDIPNVGELNLNYVTNDKDAFAGTYTTDDFLMEYTALFDKATGKTLIGFEKIDLVVKAPNGIKGAIDIQGTLIGSDGNSYQLLAHREPIPTATSTVDITADDLIVQTFFDPLGYYMEITASDDNYKLKLEVIGSGDGEYVAMDVQELRVYKASMNIEDSKDVYDQVQYAEITISDNTKKVKAAILMNDLVQYNFDLTMVTPDKPAETRELYFEQLGRMALVQDMGAFEVTSPEQFFPELSEDYLIEVNISLYGTEVPGNYTMDDVIQQFTNIRFVDPEDGEVVDAVRVFYDFKATITKKEHSYICEAEMWGINNVLYKVKVETPIPTEGELENDEAVKPVDVVYEDAPEVWYDEERGAAFCHFNYYIEEDLLSSHFAYLMFFIEQVDPTIVIPEGTYEINRYKEPYTVYASEGMYSGMDYPYSFFAIGATYATYTLWFLTSGTVEVQNNEGYIGIKVDALNSRNIPVKIEHNYVQPTAIDHTDIDQVKTKKILGKDGNIYIQRNGQTYTTTGALVK